MTSPSSQKLRQLPFHRIEEESNLTVTYSVRKNCFLRFSITVLKSTPPFCHLLSRVQICENFLNIAFNLNQPEYSVTFASVNAPPVKIKAPSVN